MDEISATHKALREYRVHELVSSTSVFSELSEEDFNALVADARILLLQTGEVLVRRGEPAGSLFVILDGELEVLQPSGSQDVPVGVRGPGDVVGETAILMGSARSATMQARTAMRLLEIQQDAFNTWLEQHPAAVKSMFGTIVHRLQSAESHILQHQHLSSLGTLAAGLAHELNNPTAAIVRGVGQLGDAVREWQQLTREITIAAVNSSSPPPFESLDQAIGEPPDTLLDADPIRRSDEEDRLARWLTANQVDRPHRLAGALVDVGWDLDSLQTATQAVDVDLLPSILRWIAAGSAVMRHLKELNVSAGVVSELVSAVRSYSRLDEAPMQNVDLHGGIEQSLTILRYKLRSVHVSRNFAPDLPLLNANPSELNQLWTNLIANAAEATGEDGNITIRTHLDQNQVVVDITDDGPGVPPDVQSRIFDPFFTTKPPGEGTGLGLAISASIVQRHRGTIELDSQPGSTRFRVRLPIPCGSEET